MTKVRQLAEGFGKFSRLAPTDRALLLRAWRLAVFVRTGLWLLPFRTVRTVLIRQAEKHRSDGHRAERLVWAVETAAGYVPQATCLTRALVLEALLQRSGIECRFCIGVRGDAGDGAIAHAWIESGGGILIGNTDLNSYTPLLTLQGRSTLLPPPRRPA